MTLEISFSYVAGDMWPYKALAKLADGQVVAGSSDHSYFDAKQECVTKAKLALAAEKPPEPITVEI